MSPLRLFVYLPLRRKDSKFRKKIIIAFIGFEFLGDLET